MLPTIINVQNKNGPFSKVEIDTLIEKHINYYKNYLAYNNHCVPDTFWDNVYNFLTAMIPIVQFEKTTDFNKLKTLEDNKIRAKNAVLIGWTYHVKETVNILYYNCVHELPLNTLYDQLEDRLHKYFHTYNFTMNENYINMEPFTSVLNIVPVEEYQSTCFLKTKLSDVDIQHIIRFHLDYSEIPETNMTEYNQIKAFLQQSLKNVISRQKYNSWIDDRPIETLYHQAYDRTGNYMQYTNVFNLEPFIVERSYTIDIIPSPIKVEESDDFTESMMEQLCKKFMGIRI